MFKVVQEDVCNLRWEAWEVRPGVQTLVALVLDGYKFISSLLNPMLSFLCDTAHTAHGLLRGDVRDCAPGDPWRRLVMHSQYLSSLGPVALLIKVHSRPVE